MSAKGAVRYAMSDPRKDDFQLAAHFVETVLVERFDEVIQCALIHEVFTRFLKWNGAHNQDRDLGSLALYGSECRQGIDTVNLRHNDVEGNKVGPARRWLLRQPPEIPTAPDDVE